MANPLNPMHVFAHLLGGGTPQGIPGAIPSSGVPADLFGGIPRSGGLFDTGDVGNDNVGSQRDAQGAQSSGDQGAGYAVPPGFQGFTGAQRGQRTGQQGYAMPDNGPTLNALDDAHGDDGEAKEVATAGVLKEANTYSEKF